MYFTGSPDSQSHTLLMIDVDCHKSGSFNGAMEFLAYLKEHVYKNLYYEASTKGKGGHGYIILDKQGLGAETLKSICLRQLQPYLNDLAKGFDVELVEVKGLPPEIEWGKAKYEVKNYKAGTLAKLPRGLLSRFDELKNTTTVWASDLRSLPFIINMTSASKSAGSIAGVHFKSGELERLKTDYWNIASKLLNGRQLMTSGRQKVEVRDVAIYLMIGRFLSNHMNVDGTLPIARWAGLWKSLYQAGDIVRGFDCHRFATIRNFISSIGLIDWQDCSYRIGVNRDGCAAKWKFSRELLSLLADSEEKASLVGTEFSYYVQLPTELTIRPIRILTIGYDLPPEDEIRRRLDRIFAICA